MTIRPRAAKSIRDIRARLRDLAAASHANTVAVRDRSREAVALEERALEDHFDTAQHELLEARSIYDLQSVDEDTGVYRLAIADAQKVLESNTKQTQVSEAALRESSRKLKSSEALVERIEDMIARRDAKAEQRSQDDISARKRP
ncbi:MAG TPA: hypothetical protein VGM39_04530 [Kofleriaceae bacterium]|jgi:flagellar FliJ protein